MPVVFREGGFEFYFYSNEGDPREPLHIHVRRGGDRAKIWLTPTVALARSSGLSARDLSAVLATARRRREEIERAWNEHFG
jgi:hypothetical protein